MGYTSQVGLTFTLPAGVTRKDVERVINLEDFFTESAEWNVLTFTQDNLETFKGISSWDKMYSSNEEYQEVKAFLDWLANQIDETEDGGYHWIEIGEDWEDFEQITYGEPWDYISYERHLR